MTRAFTDVLKDIKRGAVSDEATVGLADLANAVRRARRKGTITIKLTLSPDKHDEDVVDVEASVVVSAPRRALPKATFFLSDDGSLRRDDPKQTTLDDALAETNPNADPNAQGGSGGSGGGGQPGTPVGNLRVVAGRQE